MSDLKQAGNDQQGWSTVDRIVTSAAVLIVALIAAAAITTFV
jgi:hypothetical protein